MSRNTHRAERLGPDEPHRKHAGDGAGHLSHDAWSHRTGDHHHIKHVPADGHHEKHIPHLHIHGADGHPISRIHHVRKGETVNSIALHELKHHGMPHRAKDIERLSGHIIAGNHDKYPQLHRDGKGLKPGMELAIPAVSRHHRHSHHEGPAHSDHGTEHAKKHRQHTAESRHSSAERKHGTHEHHHGGHSGEHQRPHHHAGSRHSHEGRGTPHHRSPAHSERPPGQDAAPRDTTGQGAPIQGPAETVPPSEKAADQRPSADQPPPVEQRLPVDQRPPADQPNSSDAQKQPPTNPSSRFGPGSGTAIYDISAHTVYMPNGQRLEAHSGLGHMKDDPRYIAYSNRGPTPPNIYDLTPRGELFHGVRALRLNPESGSKMYGRDGILAHTYMLGPGGQSNGCLVFKNYSEFLRAYANGEVNRIVVVPHLSQLA